MTQSLTAQVKADFQIGGGVSDSVDKPAQSGSGVSTLDGAAPRRRKLSVLERRVMHTATCHETSAAMLEPKMRRMPRDGEFWATVALWNEHLTVAMHLKRAIVRSRLVQRNQKRRRASQ